MTATTSASPVGDPTGLDVARPGTTLFGRYELLEQVGGGATGPVWRARDALLRRDVALKHLRTSTDRDPAGARARTHHVGRAAARVHHPSIAALFDMADLDADVVLVVEFLHGVTLADVLATTGPLTPARAARIGAPLAEGLAVAHARGVVHGDLKPADVVLGPEETASVAGFGIADLDSPATAAAPRLRAPERAHGVPATPAGDVWALGATLHTAVTGRPPVGGIDPVAHTGPLGPLLAAMLAPDPAARPDAGQVNAALGAMADEGGPAGVAPSETHTPAGGLPAATTHPSTRTFGPADLPDVPPAALSPQDPVPYGRQPLATPSISRRAQRPRRRALVGAGVVGTAGLLTAGAVGVLFTGASTPTAETGAVGPPAGAVAALPPIQPQEPAPPAPEPSPAVAAVPMSVEIDDSDDDHRSQHRVSKNRDDDGDRASKKSDSTTSSGSDDDGKKKKQKKSGSDGDDDRGKSKKGDSDDGDSGGGKSDRGGDDGDDD